MRLRPYFNYGGNCAEALKFYEKHLGGKILAMMTHEQSPESSDVKPEWKNAILYAHIAIGDSEFMASDVPPERFQPMRSVYLSLSVDSDAEAERIYKCRCHPPIAGHPRRRPQRVCWRRAYDEPPWPIHSPA